MQIDVKPDCDSIIKACSVLQYYVRKKMAFSSMTLCMNVPQKVYSLLAQGAAFRGIAVRDYFAKYFTLPQGSIPWQYGKM
jgi:hypothetical protein